MDTAASDWLVRREAGFTEAERADHERWLAADSRHRDAFTRAEQTWSLLDRPRQAGRDDEMIHALGRRAARRRRRRAVGAVLALAAVVVIGVQWSSWRTPAASASAPVVVSPQKRVLPDGGVIELKPGADVAVDYGGPLRHVTLLAGEALFRVAENKARPFVVTTRGVQVRAVGTAFVVSMQTAQVDVVVTHGTVSVEPAPADGAPPLTVQPTMVGAGNRATVDLFPAGGALRVSAISDDDIGARLEWLAPRVTFSDTALADAVSVMNRFSKLQLLVDDPALARLPVSGVFHADNTDTLVRLLEINFGVRAERSGNTITLRRAN